MMKGKIEQIMNVSRWGVGVGFIVAAWWLGLTGISIASEQKSYSGSANAGLITAQENLYRTECAACHLAYPALLLPAQSWKTIMTQLDDHFGENAELAPQVAAEIGQYLTKNAGTPGRKMLKQIKGPVPLQITALPYFLRKHDEVPDRLVKGNPEVGSFSNCNACHEGAVKGDFDEDRVTIPGYGRWDD